MYLCLQSCVQFQRNLRGLFFYKRSLFPELVCYFMCFCITCRLCFDLHSSWMWGFLFSYQRKAGLFENLFIWIFFSASLKSYLYPRIAELRVCPAQTSLILPKEKATWKSYSLPVVSGIFWEEYSGFRRLQLRA